MIDIDKEEFAKLIKQYERLIITICLTFTKNYFDAEDLAQQTFLSAYKSLEKFDGNNTKAWLTTIAANKCRDYLKSKARTTISLSEDEFGSIEDNGDSPEEVLVKKNTTERIFVMCNKLKEPYKTVAISYFCKNIKLSNLAKETGQNIKTLETQLYRSKKLLRDLWKEEFM